MQAHTLLFAMLNESGHLNPTYKLARELRARGHEVCYLATPDLQEQIEAQGFRVELLFPDLFPKGSVETDQRLSTCARRRAITSRYRELVERLLVAPPFSAALHPALLLVDVTQVQFALWARRAGLPFVYVNSSLPQTKEPRVPPLRSGAPYGEGLRGQLRAELTWRRFLHKRHLSAQLADLGRMCPPYELARRLAPRFGVAARELDVETVYMPQLRGAPELVLCPEAFDFPRAARPDRHYVASIDLARSEGALPLPGLDPDRPLVYCALGSQRYRADVVPAFFARLVRALQRRPALQLLLAVGQHVRPEQLPRSPNVTVVERAPQLAALRRARLMITHGGLGSVKECIVNGVPMLGVPLDVDQPGNVARVAYHGLGLAADVERTSEQQLLQAIDQLLDDPSYRERLARMQQRFVETEASALGVQVVEQLLPHAGA